MADRPPDDLQDLDDVEEGPADEGKVLSPEELDITESEHVEELEEGRFVVSPDGPPNPDRSQQSDQAAQAESPSTADQSRHEDDTAQYTQQSEPRRRQQEQSPQPGGRGGGTSPPESNRHQQPPDRGRQRRGQADTLTEEEVHRWLRQTFEATDSEYAFDVTATFEGTVSQRKMASNDLVTVFESLMLWYAQQVDSNTPVEEILGILLVESNVPIRYPPESIHRLVRSSNLGPDDSIADLLAEIEDGVQF